MPEQVSRFRRDDKQTCQAREYGSLDKLAVHVEYLLARAATSRLPLAALRAARHR